MNLKQDNSFLVWASPEQLDSLMLVISNSFWFAFPRALKRVLHKCIILYDQLACWLPRELQSFVLKQREQDALLPSVRLVKNLHFSQEEYLTVFSFGHGFPTFFRHVYAFFLKSCS